MVRTEGHRPIAGLSLPFTLRGAHGQVRVELFSNDDPVGLGHPLVARGFDEERFRGFPVVYAYIDYEGEGVRASMGWIQTIQRIDRTGTTEFSVDRFPLGPDDSPLYTYGYAPTFFDAPANPHDPDGTWQADTWLIAIPDIIRSRRVAPIVGFRWGYALTSGRPTILTPIEIGCSEWSLVLPRMRSEHPQWQFLEELR